MPSASSASELSSLALILAFAAGSAVGSFLNVCIHRLPREESVVRPASRCPECSSPIAWRDNLPLLSYLWLRGRCRVCAARIPLRYLLVEALGGVLAVIMLLRFGAGAQAATGYVLACGLTVATFTDLEHGIIPDEVSLGGIAAGFAASWLPGGIGPAESAIGAALGGGILAAVAWGYARLAAKEGMGLGDVKLLAMVGAFLGWRGVVFTLVVASASGALVGVALLLLAGEGIEGRRGVKIGIGTGAAFLLASLSLEVAVAGATPGWDTAAAAAALALPVGMLAGMWGAVHKAARSLPIPFGPFLALGAIIHLLAGQTITSWYLGNPPLP